MAGKKSPKAGDKVITLQGDVSMAGTHRQKKMTQAQLDKQKASGAARQLK